MGLVQLDSALYDHQPNASTSTELASGFIVRRAVLTLAGVSDKDWIWFYLTTMPMAERILMMV